MTWQDAKTFCEIKTSHLITINNKNEDVFLSSMMKSSNIRAVWIGAFVVMGPVSVIVWSDGSKVSFYVLCNLKINEWN